MKPLRDDDVDSILDAAESDTDIEVRVSALSALVSLPKEPTLWLSVAERARELLEEPIKGNLGEVLIRAAGDIPVRSVIDQLELIAGDGSHSMQALAHDVLVDAQRRRGLAPRPSDAEATIVQSEPDDPARAGQAAIARRVADRLAAETASEPLPLLPHFEELASLPSLPASRLVESLFGSLIQRTDTTDYIFELQSLTMIVSQLPSLEDLNVGSMYERFLESAAGREPDPRSFLPHLAWCFARTGNPRNVVLQLEPWLRSDDAATRLTTFNLLVAIGRQLENGEAPVTGLGGGAGRQPAEYAPGQSQIIEDMERIGAVSPWGPEWVSGNASFGDAVGRDSSPEAGAGTRGDDQPIAVRPPEETALRRYPDLDYPPKVVLDVHTTLKVSLEIAPRDDKARDQALVIPLIAGETPSVRAVLHAPAFEIEGGANTQTIDVSTDVASSCYFALTPREMGSHELKVDFLYNGRYIGEASRNTLVAAKGDTAMAPLATTMAGTLRLVPGAAPADLSLRIRVDGNRLTPTLTFELSSEKEEINLHNKPLGSVKLFDTAAKEMELVYTELTDMVRNDHLKPSEAEQIDAIAAVGRNLWTRLTPQELKDEYWRIKDKVTSLIITSDEPWIPWEILKPFELRGGKVEDPFFCESFAVSRWLAGPGMAESISFGNLRPVAPEVPPGDRGSIRAELDYLEGMGALYPSVRLDTPYSELRRVKDLIENGEFNVLHFVAHGLFEAASPDRAEIVLKGGSLRPWDLEMLFEAPRARPLIFINACHGARGAYTLTGLGGWADKLVRAQVAAFIGAGWEVDGELALKFAMVFYEGLLKGRLTLGESFRQARLATRDANPANATWLAYVLYGDPEAQVVF